MACLKLLAVCWRFQGIIGHLPCFHFRFCPCDNVDVELNHVIDNFGLLMTGLLSGETKTCHLSVGLFTNKYCIRAFRSVNPLKPNIKIQILICCPYKFPIQVVGRV